MHLQYCHVEAFNVGDDLNPWLWPALIPELLGEHPDQCLVGIGTLLTRKQFSGLDTDFSKIHILSPGAWGPDSRPRMNAQWKVHGVRGPLTAQWMGLSDDQVIGDGAYLLRQLFKPETQQQDTVAFVPHHASERHIDWQPLCEQAGLRHISPCQPVDEFLSAIAGCKLVVAEAMHGAIIADALRIPWIPVQFSPTFQTGKWFDWFASMEISPSPFQRLSHAYQHTLPFGRSFENAVKKTLNKAGIGQEKWSRLPVAFLPDSERTLNKISGQLESVAHSGTEQLSTDSRLSEIESRLLEAVHRLRQST